MDSHFDPNAFHPSFTSDTGTHLSGNVFSMTLSHFHQMAHEYNLPDDVVQDAVHGACDFLKMDDLEIKQAGQVGVFTHNPQTLNDDVLGFNRQQMLDMGVHDGKTLSLICTHEAAHCMLQYLSSTHELSNWQEELSCDAFMGVRAAVEGIDTGKVEDTLRNMQTSTTHPNGELRLRYLEIGKQIGEDLKSHDIPVTTDNIMARLSEYVSNDAELIFKQEAIVNELANKNGGGYDAANTEEQRESQDAGTEKSFKPSYSDAEIDNLRSQVSNAEYTVGVIARELENWRTKESLLRDDSDHVSDHAHALDMVSEYEKKLNNARAELKEAKARLNNAL